jgi:hypothetical protein
LFVTAFFYGFTYGAGGKGDMMWYDIILLAGLTTALNLPVVKILMNSMNSVGLGEFKAQFPILYAEYERRLAFEKLALAYLLKKRGLKLEDSDSSSDNIINLAEKAEQGNTGSDDAEDRLLDMVLLYLCCRSKPKSEEEDISELTLHQLMRKMATLIKESYPYIEAYPSSWGLMPFHTRGGFLYTFINLGWIAWCLNYLLLFAAAHTNDVGENIMKSYATSEITTVFLTQPLIIGASYVFYKLLNAYGKYLPFYHHPKEAFADFMQAKELLLHKNNILRLPGNNAWNTKEVKRASGLVRPLVQKLDSANFNIIGWDMEWRFNKKGRPVKSPEAIVALVDSLFKLNPKYLFRAFGNIYGLLNIFLKKK